MNAPLIIFSVSAFAITLQMFLRQRVVLAAIVAGMFAFFIALIISALPIDQVVQVAGISIRIEDSWVLMGRSFSLGDQNRGLVAYLYLSGGLYLLGSWRSQTSRVFYPLALGIVTLVSASLMIDPFLFAAILLELSAIAALLILSTRERGESRGGLRLLIQYTIAMLAILIAGSQIDVTVPAGFIYGQSVILLLGFGLAVLISIPPFHSWLPIASTETHPMAIGLSGTILPAAGFFFILRFLSVFSPEQISPDFFSYLRLGGLALSLLCSLWALTEEGLHKIGSYLLIADISLILIALGFGTPQGYTLALVLLAVRVLGISAWSLGLALTRDDVEGGDPSSMDVRPRWLAIVGLASLVGLPLTAGFPARWELLTTLRSLGDGQWIVLLFSYGVMCYTVVLNARELFLRKEIAGLNPRGKAEDLVAAIVIILIVGFGFFSTMFLDWGRSAATGLGLIGQ